MLTAQRATAIMGIAAVFFYMSGFILPLPDIVVRQMAFAFGPLLAAGFIGLYGILGGSRGGLKLRVACIFGVVAGALVTTMIVVQIGNQMWLQEGLAKAGTETAEQAARLVWRAVNRVQALIDVAWDIFISVATVRIGIVIFTHPRFGKIFGGLGIAIGTLLLVLNLQTFPTGPAYAGSIDVGPLDALWFLAVFIRIIFIKRLVSEVDTV